MELTTTETGFEANYRIGRYNLAGQWEESKPTAAALPEVIRTQEDFHKKLAQTLQQRFELSLSLHQQSTEFA
ncbi:transcriptional regulator Crl [Vibrio metschnikovii CIP 69.14]|nr:transcriptional regulator Crl [Vibrio metschnikovii CIP 69.14]